MKQIMYSSSEIRPTKGYLIDLKRRIVFIESGYELLKLKRDYLAKELTITIESFRGKRSIVITKLREIYKELAAANVVLGPIEVKGYALSLKGHLEIEILPKSIMGVNYPYIKIISKPQLVDNLDIMLKQLIDQISEVFIQVIKLAELETKIVRIAEDLAKTNRKVNVLRDIIIPTYNNRIKSITEKLDEETLEELVRMKISRRILEGHVQ